MPAEHSFTTSKDIGTKISLHQLVCIKSACLRWLAHSRRSAPWQEAHWKALISVASWETNNLQHTHSTYGVARQNAPTAQAVSWWCRLESSRESSKTSSQQLCINMVSTSSMELRHQSNVVQAPSTGWSPSACSASSMSWTKPRKVREWYFIQHLAESTHHTG